jgi:hypothetical protein
MLMRANTVGPLYAASVAKTPASVAKTPASVAKT